MTCNPVSHRLISQSSSLADTAGVTKRRTRRAPRKTSNTSTRRNRTAARAKPANKSAAQPQSTVNNDTSATNTATDLMHYATAASRHELTQQSDLGTAGGYQNAEANPSHAWGGNNHANVVHLNGTVVTESVNMLMGAQSSVDPLLVRSQNNDQAIGNVPTDTEVDKTGPQQKTVGKPVGTLGQTSHQGLTETKLQDSCLYRESQMVGVQGRMEAVSAVCEVTPGAAPGAGTLNGIDTSSFSVGPLELDSMFAAVNPAGTSNTCDGAATTPHSAGFRGTSSNHVGPPQLNLIAPSDPGSSAVPSNVSAALQYPFPQVTAPDGGDTGNLQGRFGQSRPAAQLIPEVRSSDHRAVGFPDEQAVDVLRCVLPSAACPPLPANTGDQPQYRNPHHEPLNPSGRANIEQRTNNEPPMTVGAGKPSPSQFSRQESLDKVESVGGAAHDLSASLDRLYEESVVGSATGLSAKGDNGNRAINNERNVTELVEGGIMTSGRGQTSAYQGIPTAVARSSVAGNSRLKPTEPQRSQKCKSPRRRSPKGSSRSAAILGNKPSNAANINGHSVVSNDSANLESDRGNATAQDSEPQTSTRAVEPAKRSKKRSRKSSLPTQEKRAKKCLQAANATSPALLKSAGSKHKQNAELPSCNEGQMEDSLERIAARDEKNGDRQCFNKETAKGGGNRAKVTLGFMKPTQLDVSLPPQCKVPPASKPSHHPKPELFQPGKPQSVAKIQCQSTPPLPHGCQSEAKAVVSATAEEPQKNNNGARKLGSRVEEKFAPRSLVGDIGELVTGGEVSTTKSDGGEMGLGRSVLLAKPLLAKSCSTEEIPPHRKTSVADEAINETSPGMLATPRDTANAISAKFSEISQLTQTGSPCNTEGTGSKQQQQKSPAASETPQSPQKSTSKEETAGGQIADGNAYDPKCRHLKTDLGRKPAFAGSTETQKHAGLSPASSGLGSVASGMRKERRGLQGGIRKLNLASNCVQERAGNIPGSGLFKKPCATENFVRPVVQAVNKTSNQNATSVPKPVQASPLESNAAHFGQQRAPAAGGSSIEAPASEAQPPSLTDCQRDQEKAATPSAPTPSSQEKGPLKLETRNATGHPQEEGVLDNLGMKSSSTSSDANAEKRNAMKELLSYTPAKEHNNLGDSAELQAGMPSEKHRTGRRLRQDPSSDLPKQAENHCPPSTDKENASRQTAHLAPLAEPSCADQAAKVAPSGEDAIPTLTASVVLRLRIRAGSTPNKNASSYARQPKPKRASRRTRRATSEKPQNRKSKQGTGVQELGLPRTNLASREKKTPKGMRNESRVLRKRKSTDRGPYMDSETETETDDSILRTKRSTRTHGNVCGSPERHTESSSSVQDPADDLSRRVSEVGHPRTLPSPVKLPKGKAIARKPAFVSVQPRLGSEHEHDSIPEKMLTLDRDESRILKKGSRSDEDEVRDIGRGLVVQLKCALCQKSMATEENSKHPLFPLRSLIICRGCHVSIRSRFHERYGHARAEKCRLFVGVVEEMIRCLLPSQREAAKLTGVHSSLVSESRDSVLKRAKSHPVPFEMLVVMRTVFVKIGLGFDHGKLVMPATRVTLPVDEDLRFLIAEAIPRSLLDLEVGSTAGERAWLAVFGEEFRLDQSMPSCRIIARILGLVDVRTDHCGVCRWSSSSTKETCSIQFNLTDVEELLIGASEIKTSVHDVIPKVGTIRAATQTHGVREREVEDDLIFGSTEFSCCICAASEDSGGLPFRMANCTTCPRKFCSMCLTNVLGTVELIRANTAAESYSCMVCRTRTSRPSAQKNSLSAGVDGGIKKRTRARRGGSRSHYLPMLQLSTAMRRDLQLSQDRSMNNPKIRFAKQCEAVNVKQLAYIQGEGRKSRSIPDELCLRCRQPVRPSNSAENTGKTTRDETVLKCTERNCAVVMHRSCHSGRKSNKTRGLFAGMVCPRHRCSKCQGKAEVKLLRCRTCPVTLCRDHVEPRQIHIYSDKFIACPECKPKLAVPQMSIHRAAPMLRTASDTPKGNDILGSLSLRQRQRQAAVQRQVESMGQT
eukprot:GFKZ01013783.1.p1 GENE.GFKZ01013783.1~~GFKZ01013783.1.p1  ORF type:complete len:2255 (-),score=183.22 GFKZ01013783.1:3483-9572(-)